jgi:hypothetical protein
MLRFCLENREVKKGSEAERLRNVVVESPRVESLEYEREAAGQSV